MDHPRSFPIWIQKMLQDKQAAIDDKNPNRIIIHKHEAILQLLNRGMTLVHNPSNNAMWLEQDGESTPYKCGWAVKRRLEKLGLILQTGIDDFRLYYSLSKAGEAFLASEERKLRRFEEEKKATELLSDTKIVESAAPPVQRNENVVHVAAPKKAEWMPRAFSIIRTKDQRFVDSDPHSIHGCVFQNGKTVIMWTTTGTVAVFDTFQQFEQIHLQGSMHGKATVEWADSVKIKKALKEQEPAKKSSTVLKACYYCNNGFVTGTRGRKAWRNVCKQQECQKKYWSDWRTMKELKKDGLIDDERDYDAERKDEPIDFPTYEQDKISQQPLASVGRTNVPQQFPTR